ncbi:wd-40 repeat protein [Stylonychia lemnae]|uniref:Wd-40 repeat protein n=1 Tax=Stylonychia lemnae TaxID=5949 RepID=A0A078A6I8_STYLE|nr:wd-40 repeat protein [Stylonychia lemnae]|eukprot:CDW77824.1 wd-40 repeat protein [Stylonychia lemnae]
MEQQYNNIGRQSMVSYQSSTQQFDQVIKNTFPLHNDGQNLKIRWNYQYQEKYLLLLREPLNDEKLYSQVLDLIDIESLKIIKSRKIQVELDVQLSISDDQKYLICQLCDQDLLQIFVLEDFLIGKNEFLRIVYDFNGYGYSMARILDNKGILFEYLTKIDRNLKTNEPYPRGSILRLNIDIDELDKSQIQEIKLTQYKKEIWENFKNRQTENQSIQFSSSDGKISYLISSFSQIEGSSNSSLYQIDKEGFIKFVKKFERNNDEIDQNLIFSSELIVQEDKIAIFMSNDTIHYIYILRKDTLQLTNKFCLFKTNSNQTFDMMNLNQMKIFLNILPETIKKLENKIVLQDFKQSKKLVQFFKIKQLIYLLCFEDLEDQNTFQIYFVSCNDPMRQQLILDDQSELKENANTPILKYKPQQLSFDLINNTLYCFYYDNQQLKLYDFMKKTERLIQDNTDNITPTQFEVDYQQRIIFLLDQRSIFAFDFDSGEKIDLGFYDLGVSFTKITLFNNMIAAHYQDRTYYYFQIPNRRLERVIKIEFPVPLEFDNQFEKQVFIVPDIRHQEDTSNLFRPFEMIEELEKAEYIEISENQGITFYSQHNQNPVCQVDIFFTSLDLQKMRDIIHMNTDQQIKSVKQDLNIYLKYYPGLGNIFNSFALKPQILEQISKLIQTSDQSAQKLIILRDQIGGKTPLQLAIEKNQVKSISILLELMIKYQENKHLNCFIDENLVQLMKFQIDLSEYFDTSMSIFQITHEDFPPLHQNGEEIIVGYCNIDKIDNIDQKYEEIFSAHLDEVANDQDVLSTTDVNEYFESTTIQTIIKYKWEAYTKRFFERQFYLYLIYLLTFIFEIFYSLSNGKTQKDYIEDDRILTVIIITKMICSLILIYFLNQEVKQARKQEGYLKEIQNLFDFSLIISYFVMTIIEFGFQAQKLLILAQIIVVILSFMKLYFFLRIYDGFSFLVTMMSSVFYDLQYFIAFFLIFIFQFGLILTILFQAQWIEEYDKITTVAYFLMAFRISSGDFQLDAFKDQDSFLVGLSWILWLVGVIVLNVVFMNFIIAVISESYEKVMQKSVAEQFRVKVQMIAEREIHFSKEDTQNPYLFPKYLILRRPIDTIDSDSGEWQGFIKDLKSTIKVQNLKLKNEIIQNLNQSKNHHKKQDKIAQSQINQEELSQIKSKLDKIDEDNKLLFAKFDEIKKLILEK